MVPCDSSFELFLQNDLAGQEGFEPPTPGFGVRRSTVRATGLQNAFIIKMVIWSLYVECVSCKIDNIC